MDKKKYLLDQLDAKIKDFGKDSDRHKHMYRQLRYGVFGLTALSALLAGLALSMPEAGTVISVLILLVSGVVGVLTSIEGLHKPSELWIHERTTYYLLMDLKREAEFVLDAGSTDEDVEGFFYRFQAILGASNEKWNRGIVGNSQQPSTPVATAGAASTD
jgi:hypothetical protein